MTMMTMMTVIDNVVDHYTYQTRWGQKRTHAKIHPDTAYTYYVFFSVASHLNKHDLAFFTALTRRDCLSPTCAWQRKSQDYWDYKSFPWDWQPSKPQCGGSQLG